MKLAELNEASNFVVAFSGEEYRVPGPDGREATAYYTDDKEELFDYVLNQYGEEAARAIKIRRVSPDWMLAKQTSME